MTGSPDACNLLHGEVALVTGGARGIGSYIVRRLARAGAAVAIGCRSGSDEARTLAAEITSSGGKAIVAPADLTDPTATAEMADAVAAELGAVTILVHNAAPARKGALLLEDDWGQFDLHHRVAVQAPWVLAQRVVPGMRVRGKGRIIFVSTTSTDLYVPGFGAYCAAKGAMDVFARYLAVELGHGGITVNTVAPGMTIKSDTQGPHPDGERLPLRGIAHGWDIAEAVMTFACDAGSGLTGTKLPIDGGMRLLEAIRGHAPRK